MHSIASDQMFLLNNPWHVRHQRQAPRAALRPFSVTLKSAVSLAKAETLRGSEPAAGRGHTEHQCTVGLCRVGGSVGL